MDEDKKAKRITSFRLSDDSHKMLSELSKTLGISKTAVIEIIIREKHKEIK